MDDQEIKKIIYDDSHFLSSLEEDYDDIFTFVLPLMDIKDIELLKRYYSGEFMFSNEEINRLIVYLNKLASKMLNELIFHLIIVRYDFEDVNIHVENIINEERIKYNKNKTYSDYDKAISFGYLSLVKFVDRMYVEKSSLEIASRNGHLNIIKYLLSEPNKLVESLEYCITRIFTSASIGGHIEILKYMINTYGDIDIKTFECSLHNASHKNHLETVKYLVSLGYKIELDILSKCIEIALQKKNLEIVKYLFSLEDTDCYIDFNVFGYGLLCAAITSGSLDIVKYLFSLENTHGKLDIHSKFADAAKVAISCGHLEILEYLFTLEHTHGKIIIDYICLKAAAMYNHLTMLKYLINITTEEHSYSYLFHHAIKNGNLDMFVYLTTLEPVYVNDSFKHICNDIIAAKQIEIFKYMVSLNLTHCRNYRVELFLYTIKDNSLDIFKYLITIEPNYFDKYFIKTCKLMIMHGRLDFLEHVIELNPEKFDDHFRDFSIHAIVNGCSKIFKRLFKLSNIHIFNDDFIIHSIRHAQIDILKFVLSLGPTKHSVEELRELASSHGNLEIIRYLQSLKSVNFT